MSAQSILKKKIDDLISLMLTDGVQPSDLADNIFFDSYVKVSYIKINDEVIGELVFVEESDSLQNAITLRYFYDLSRKVVRIEEENYNCKKIVWDRNHQEAQMINEIIDMMNELYLPEQIKKFISTLPEELKLKINKASAEKRAS
ncbi:hypothetical protein [Anaerospora hongkongensis]|uniref:hypothetical protein n=1 Tax=Anaerospora hongkongensis TaxID=244830 RepID=UPI002897F5C1|nr:hypothetical protein [Anaerospora hongkongensis]